MPVASSRHFMPKETSSAPAPNFHRKQLVRLSLHNVDGELKNEFARRAEPYFGQTGVLVKCQRYRVAGVPMLVYSVKFDDGMVLKLPEECLFEIMDSRIR